MTFLTDVRFALRSLLRTKGLAATVVLTLALGIGANAAIYTLVRGVLLRPLVNRDEERLVYIQQSAPGIAAENVNFSVPEIDDLRSRAKTLVKFGDFSTIGFTMVGLGEPREVRAGVVGGTYFDVMGLRPVLGRLIGPDDDGPSAAGVVVLTHQFWMTSLGSDPSVIGKTVRLGARSATIIGVLEPSVPYPAETEIIANVVTSPHHLSATMVTGRVHRMTELFARLAPGADLDSARAELRAIHGAILKEHPEAYPANADFRINAVLLRDQLTSGARTVLFVLLAASALVFVIACSNVANLILARSVRREGELSIRAALGAGAGSLRRTLLAESLVLCGAGAIVGLSSARPMVAILGRYASRFSVRALDLGVDSSLLWVGALLAVAAAVLLAFVPRLPTAQASHGPGLASSGFRISGSATRRLRVFAVTQIAASFILLAGAVMLLRTLFALQATPAGFETHNVLALNVPVLMNGKTNEENVAFFKEAMRQITELPGVERVAVGTVVPWRDAGQFGPGFEFGAEGHDRSPGDESPRAGLRAISPGFFAALGVPVIAGRDFDGSDRTDSEQVVIVSETLAARMFPNESAVGRHVMWTDPVMEFIGISTKPRRIVGVVSDIDDEHVVPVPTLTVYHPFEQQEIFGGRLFVHASTDPYPLVPSVTRIVRGLAADQPVEHAATLDDVRVEVLTPYRLNTLVFGGFAFVAVAIAVVGVAGVLAFTVSARTREFGIRLAIGSRPRDILTAVVAEGALIAFAGVAAGATGGYALARLLGSYLQDAQMPGALTVAASAVLLLLAAIVASAVPAARAARVDVMQTLRSE
jgi:putative ABC transport system permease protein